VMSRMLRRAPVLRRLLSVASHALVPQPSCKCAHRAILSHVAQRHSFPLSSLSCGAGNRLLYYQYKGATPLFDWHRPNVTGRYEFLVGGPIVPLQTVLGLNNKVTFLEKLGSGPQNSTHAYELDYTLAHDIDKAWRDMHVKVRLVGFEVQSCSCQRSRVISSVSTTTRTTA